MGDMSRWSSGIVTSLFRQKKKKKGKSAVDAKSRSYHFLAVTRKICAQHVENIITNERDSLVFMVSLDIGLFPDG